MYLDPDKATTIKLAALVCCIIRTFMHDSYTPDGYVDFETKWILWIGIGEKTVSLSVFKSMSAWRSGNKFSKNAEQIRGTFAELFLGPGQIPWR